MSDPAPETEEVAAAPAAATAPPKKAKAGRKPKAAAAAVEKVEKVKKSPKPKVEKKPAAHPPTATLVQEALANLNDKGGSSLQAIKKSIADTNRGTVDVEKLAPFIRKYLKSGVAQGTLIQVKGKGASGSFKLAVKGKAEKPSDAEVSPKAKKAPAKKEAKSPKKAASSKSPKKVPAKIGRPKKASSPAKAAKPAEAAKKAPAKKRKGSQTSGRKESQVSEASGSQIKGKSSKGFQESSFCCHGVIWKLRQINDLPSNNNQRPF